MHLNSVAEIALIGQFSKLKLFDQLNEIYLYIALLDPEMAHQIVGVVVPPLQICTQNDRRNGEQSNFNIALLDPDTFNTLHTLGARDYPLTLYIENPTKNCIK